MTTPDENTHGRTEARKAVEAAERGAARTDTIIARSRDSLAALRAQRETNHFADKFREILQGGH